MFAKKRMLKRRLNIMIDMDDFLLTYASQKIGLQSNLAQTVYRAGYPNLQGLDTLFQDQGYGRKQKFVDIASGALNDLTPASQRNQNIINQKALALANRAMRYLGKHANKFNHWKLA